MPAVTGSTGLMSHDAAVSVPSRKAQRRANITSGDQSHPTWHPTTYVVLSLLLILPLTSFRICTCQVKLSYLVSQSLLCLFSTFTDCGHYKSGTHVQKTTLAAFTEPAGEYRHVVPSLDPILIGAHARNFPYPQDYTLPLSLISIHPRVWPPPPPRLSTLGWSSGALIASAATPMRPLRCLSHSYAGSTR